VADLRCGHELLAPATLGDGEQRPEGTRRKERVAGTPQHRLRRAISLQNEPRRAVFPTPASPLTITTAPRLSRPVEASASSSTANCPARSRKSSDLPGTEATTAAWAMPNGAPGRAAFQLWPDLPPRSGGACPRYFGPYRVPQNVGTAQRRWHEIHGSGPMGCDTDCRWPCRLWVCGVPSVFGVTLSGWHKLRSPSSWMSGPNDGLRSARQQRPHPVILGRAW
jgi:hypothetical protein